VTPTIELFFISERTVFRLLRRGLLGRPSAVIGIRPLWPALSGTLGRFVGWAQRRGLCQPIADVVAGTEDVGRDLLWEETYDVFQKVEPWAEDHLRFADAGGDYAMAFKHTVCGYLNASNQALFDLRTVDQAAGERADVRVVGADAELLGMYEAYFGRAPRVALAAGGSARRLVNLTSLIAVLVSCVVATLHRVRLAVRPEQLFLGWDFGASQPLIRLLGEMTDDPGDAMIVFRNDWMAEHYRDWATEYRRCAIGDGVFSVAQAVNTMAMVFRHLADLNRRYGYLAPALYRLTMALVYRRVVTRALLNRYRFQYFWSHDDYNVEHIIRSQEVRRIGGKSFGINHGMAVPEGISPIWRYIDYDIYYVFGIGLFDRFYRDTWSANMTVRSVGSYGMGRDQLISLDKPRNKNIVFFFSTSIWEEEIFTAVKEIAIALPDRQVLVKLKPSRKRQGKHKRMMEEIGAGPRNLVETTADTYELLAENEYALCNPCSTVPVEAVQFGVKTFVFDFFGEDRYSYYREFPNLTVSSGKQVLDLIRSLERGTWDYPRDEYGNLVDLSGRIIFDRIRLDLGMHAKQPDLRIPLPVGPTTDCPNNATRQAAGGQY